MWRPWASLRWRLRLGTFLLLTIIVALSFSLFVQRQREARLRSAFLSLKNYNKDAIKVALDQPIAMQTVGPMNFSGLLIDIRRKTTNGTLWGGIPIYVDPVGLQEAGVKINAPVKVPTTKGTPAKQILEDVLSQLKLDYVIKDGLLTITSKESADKPLDDGSTY
jgi:hypothetical protein